MHVYLAPSIALAPLSHQKPVFSCLYDAGLIWKPTQLGTEKMKLQFAWVQALLPKEGIL